jgi:cation transport ATPase
MKLTHQNISSIKDKLSPLGFSQKEIQIEILDHLCAKIEDEYNPKTHSNMSEFAAQVIHKFPKGELEKMAKSATKQIDRLIIKRTQIELKELLFGRKILHTLSFIVLLFIANSLTPTVHLDIFYRFFPFTLSLMGTIVALAIYFIKDYETAYNSIIIERTNMLYLISITAIGWIFGGFLHSAYTDNSIYLKAYFYIGCTMIFLIPATVTGVHLWSAKYFKEKFIAFS